MSEEKFSKCGEGKKCKCKISGVRKKKELKEKFGRKKNQSIFGWKFKVKDFAKFVFTSWALCCKTWLKLKNWNFTLQERVKVKGKKNVWVVDVPLVGRHVVNESKVGFHVVNDR